MHAHAAEAFLNYKRDGKTITGVINHIDKNKLNNNIENLEVTTQRKNMIHSMTKRRLNGLPSNIKYQSNGAYTVSYNLGSISKLKEGKGCSINRGTYKLLEDAIKARDPFVYKLNDCQYKEIKLIR